MFGSTEPMSKEEAADSGNKGFILGRTYSVWRGTEGIEGL
jgi:hypothetical protein